jgi:hypothetical protein
MIGRDEHFVIEPIRLSFEVACPPERAADVRV